MNPDSSLQSLECDRFRIHETDISVQGQRASSGVFHLKLKGPQFDLEPFLTHNSSSKKDESFSLPIQVTIDFDRVRFDEQRMMTNVSGLLKNNKTEWKEFNIRGLLPGQTNGKNNFLQMIRQPTETKDKLRIQSNNAGSVLHLLNISDSTRQGQLQVLGEKYPDDSWQGTIQIDQFHLADAPVMTKLLSLASPFGVFDALSGQSVVFEQFQSKFVWHKGKILLENGRASGTSLGFTVNGRINRNKRTLKLQGAVLPYNAVNIFLLKIPIVGQLLGGEQGGIWGISYTLEGSTESPEVTVNPFSALTPGFLRFIFEASIEDTPEEDSFPKNQVTAPVRSPHRKQIG